MKILHKGLNPKSTTTTYYGKSLPFFIYKKLYYLNKLFLYYYIGKENIII